MVSPYAEYAGSKSPDERAYMQRHSIRDREGEYVPSDSYEEPYPGKTNGEINALLRQLNAELDSMSETIDGVISGIDEILAPGNDEAAEATIAAAMPSSHIGMRIAESIYRLRRYRSVLDNASKRVRI